MALLTRLQQLDRRLIYLLFGLALSVPLLWPIGIPIQAGATTRAAYELIENLNPATDTVLLSFDYSPSSGIGIHSLALVIVEHLTQRGISWAGISFDLEGPMMMDTIITDLETRGLQYGHDVVNLGYLAGEENAIRRFALDPSVIATDARGNQLANLPIMRGIDSIHDFALVYGLAASDLGIIGWLRQVADPLGIDLALGVAVGKLPVALPYAHSGQLQGLIGGLGAAAEYEVLLGSAGIGVSLMDAQTIGHVVFIGFVLIGNIIHLFSRRTKLAQVGGKE